MDKISGIIPSSPRVKSTDMRDAHPVRPGVPTFGRPVGVSHLASNVTRSGLDTMVDRPMTDRQRLEFEKAKIVDRVSNGFFMKETPQPTLEPATQVQFQSRIPEDSYSVSEVYEPEVSYEPVLEAAPEAESSEPEFIKPGSYLDVQV